MLHITDDGSVRHKHYAGQERRLQMDLRIPVYHHVRDTVSLLAPGQAV